MVSLKKIRLNKKLFHSLSVHMNEIAFLGIIQVYFNGTIFWHQYYCRK